MCARFSPCAPLAWLLAVLLWGGSVVSCVRADDPVTITPLQEEIVAKLYGPVERQADLEDFAARATALKVPDQTIAEARLAYGIRTRTLDERLQESIRQLDNLCRQQQWRKEDSRLFNTADEAQGVLFFARALFAARDKNDAEYERCMKEAFWMNLEAGPVLAGELRVHRAMASLLNLHVPMNKPLKTSAGQPTTFKDLVEGKTGILLIFWTSDSQPSLDLIDPLKASAERLARGNVATVWIDSQDVRGHAEQVRKAHDVKFPWLVDAEDRPVAKALRVDTLPRAVLVDQYGRVRYHGYPVSADLDSTLKELGVDTTGD